MPHSILAKGGNSTLPTHDGEKLSVGLQWQSSSSNSDVDLFLIMVDSNGRVPSNEALVFYNQPQYLDGAVEYIGRKSTGTGAQEHSATISLSQIPAIVQRIAIAASLDSSDRVLGQLGDLRLVVKTPSGVSFDVPASDLSSENVAVMGEIYRRNGDWKIRSVSQGWTGGLESFLGEHGVALGEEEAPPAAMARHLPAPDQHRINALHDLEHRIREKEAVLRELESRIIETREIKLLQELGIYEFAHPLDDAIQYKDRLDRLRTKVKETAKERGVTGAANWAVNGSLQDGARMVREQCRLMLRAYNAEADNCIRTVRSHNLEPTVSRLTRAKDSIQKLGRSMAIQITEEYHELRLAEIRLTSDYHLKVAEERETQRAFREDLREQEKVERELQRAREKFEKERDQYEAALQIAINSGDASAVATMKARLEQAEINLRDIENREANAKAGYVYVISNLGAFGDQIVKIGMTRRLEPTERIRELSGAGVPFLYDVHVLFFSDDAAGLEGQLHREFESRRVNRVNLRREFFYATPHEVREAVRRIIGATTLEFREEAEASEFRRSMSMSKGE
jgi:stress response protein SCP2